MSRSKIAIVCRKQAGRKNHVLKLSLLACAATLALNCVPAHADGGRAGTVSQAGVNYPGGAGGVDGPLSSATGVDGGYAFGGGGGVDLTTGNGAPGGAGSIPGNPAAPRGTTGLVGTTGQFIAAPAQITTTVSGGTGNAGQTEVVGVNTSGGNGGGGVGISATSAITVTATSRVTGGAGFSFATNGVHGGAGGGGVGIFSSANVTVDSGGQVTGGAGGSNTSGPNAAGGGGGAAAIFLSNSGTVQNSGALTGGVGGRSTQGSGGDGGAGIQMLAGGTVINMAGGTITGGAGGNGRVFAPNSLSPGDGGAGIKGADISIINAGNIGGGAGGTATGWTPVGGQAIQFTGGVNALEIWSGSNIAGNVQAFSNADTFKLGGSTDAAFDLSQLGAAGKYQGFGQFVKTGASTWTLTGMTAEVTPWTLMQGALQIASDAQLGDASSGLTFNGGVLRVTGTVMAGTPRAITWGTNGGGFDIDDATNRFTLTQSLSGGGPLTKLGAGTLQLADNNTYTGGTTIGGGTLIGSASGFGSGAITDNAALVVDQPADATMANAINGSGSFTKRGTARLNYTGTGNLSGATSVAAGTLAVNGSLASSAVTVQSGASLGGNGTVGATAIQSGGTVAPGNSIGTLHINGAFTQSAGSVYQVEVDPGSNASDLIAVNGTATLQSGAGLNVTKSGPGEYQPGSVYRVLSTSGGLSGTYNRSGQTTGVSAFLGLKDSYDANNAYLTVVALRDLAQAATTPNQVAVAQAVDAMPPASDPAKAVLNLPGDNAARGAFDQLSGQVQASAQGTLLANGLYVRDMALGRLRDEACAAELEQAAQPGHCEGKNLSIWGQGFGDWGGVAGNGNAEGLNHSGAGFLVGVDVPVAEWRLGFFGGYSHSDFHLVSGSAAGDSNDYHLGAYGGTRIENLAVRLGASYSWNGITTDRAVAIGSFSDQLQGIYEAGTTQAFGELGYGLDMDGVSLEPFVNLAYVSLHIPAFTEAGGPAALTARANTIDDTVTTLGVRPSVAIALDGLEASLRGMTGWQHTFGTVTPTSQLSFASGNVFSVSGAPIARDAAALEAGVDVAVADGLVLGLTYGGRFSGRTTDQTARGTIRASF